MAEKNNITKSISLFIKFLITVFLFKSFYNEKIKFLREFKKDKPCISIFLPIYNKEKYIERSIGSIQCQTLRDIEIIPINDGSTDNSLNILERLAEKDPRITIMN